MWTPDIKSKRQPSHDPNDLWSWIAIVVATVLAVALVLQTVPAVRNADGQQIEAKSG